MKFQKVPRICPNCNHPVLLGDNRILYGRAYGKERFFICYGCNSYAYAMWSEKNQRYEACERMRSKSIRKIQKECMDLLEQKYKHLVPQYLYNEASICVLHLLAVRLGISVNTCKFNIMSNNELFMAKEELQHSWPEIEESLRKLREFHFYHNDEQMEIESTIDSYKKQRKLSTEDSGKENSLSKEEQEQIRWEVDKIARGKRKYYRHNQETSIC